MPITKENMIIHCTAAIYREAIKQRHAGSIIIMNKEIAKYLRLIWQHGYDAGLAANDYAHGTLDEMIEKKIGYEIKRI